MSTYYRGERSAPHIRSRFHAAPFIRFQIISHLSSPLPLSPRRRPGRAIRWWCVRRRTDLTVDSPMSAAEGEKTFRDHFRARWGREVDGPLLQAELAKAYPLALIARSTHKCVNAFASGVRSLGTSRAFRVDQSRWFAEALRGGRGRAGGGSEWTGCG